MTIKIENLKRQEALALLNAINKKVAPSWAIQGKQECRYFTTDTVTVTLKVQENWIGLQWDNNTLEIQSNYWTESTMRDWLPEEYQEKVNCG